MKETWQPGTMIYPLPAVMVSCGHFPDKCNILTVAWTGTICSDPAMCYISVRKSRYSHELIKESGEFVINLTNKQLARATDWCGIKSGRDFDKFKEMGLTPIKATKISAPMIEEAPVNIECKVVDIKELGSHDMFIANVLAVNADSQYLNKETGAFNLQSAEMLTYMHGQYYLVGEPIGKFGWTVQKKNK